tara:strand:- start:31137 stop:31463 length:327 start_codon:yes stop_codon:yes gene_type:complete
LTTSLSADGNIDIDTAARGIRVRAYTVRLRYETLSFFAIDAWQRHFLGPNPPSSRGPTLTLSVAGDRAFALPGHKTYGTFEAGDIACGKQLFGIRGPLARTARFLRCG